jgi:hypothetical protein
VIGPEGIHDDQDNVGAIGLASDTFGYRETHDDRDRQENEAELPSR